MSFLRKGLARHQQGMTSGGHGGGMPPAAAVDSIDWVATGKVVKVIQLRDSIPEETLAVLKKMLKGSELAPSLISLSVMDSIALNCSRGARTQLADRKWMKRFFRLCSESHPASPAIAQLLVNWACVFSGEELGHACKVTAESLGSRLKLQLPPASEFAFQMRELIQQETPMVGFQRGMDFLTNFPDFLPGMAVERSSYSGPGRLPSPAPRASPASSSGSHWTREQGLQATPRQSSFPRQEHVGEAARGSPAGNMSASTANGSGRTSQAAAEREEVATMRAAVAQLQRLEVRVRGALAAPCLPPGADADAREATDLATRCLSWREEIKRRVSEEVSDDVLAQLLAVNDELNTALNAWQTTGARYAATQPPAAPAVPPPPLIDLGTPPPPTPAPAPAPSAGSGSTSRMWDAPLPAPRVGGTAPAAWEAFPVASGGGPPNGGVSPPLARVSGEGLASHPVSLTPPSVSPAWHPTATPSLHSTHVPSTLAAQAAIPTQVAGWVATPGGPAPAHAMPPSRPHPAAPSGGAAVGPPSAGACAAGSGAIARRSSDGPAGSDGSFTGSAPSLSGRSVRAIEQENEGLRQEVDMLRQKLASTVVAASPFGAREVGGGPPAAGSLAELARRVEEMASAEERLVLELRTLRTWLKERDDEIVELKQQLEEAKSSKGGARMLLHSVSMPQGRGASTNASGNPFGGLGGGNAPLKEGATEEVAVEAIGANGAVGANGPVGASPMKAYYRQPALRLMSPHQFRALSTSLAKPLGARLDALRGD